MRCKSGHPLSRTTNRRHKTHGRALRQKRVERRRRRHRASRCIKGRHRLAGLIGTAEDPLAVGDEHTLASQVEAQLPVLAFARSEFEAVTGEQELAQSSERKPSNDHRTPGFLRQRLENQYKRCDAWEKIGRPGKCPSKRAPPDGTVMEAFTLSLR